ncbi:MAG TPA: hydroxymethylglutaryl-CoA lyase [Thermoanaerobaculia bacterium]
MLITLHEVGPRDGLQAETKVVPTETKIRWIERLASSGIDIIQVGSFVHPEKVPQMADTDRVFEWFQRPERKPPRTVLSGLVLNEKGLERGLACGVDMFCMGVSASETHSRKNTGMSIAEATTRIVAMAKRAESEGKPVQMSVQSAFGCGYEGEVPEERVLELVRRFIGEGIRRISLADTVGHADPARVERLYSAIFDMDAQVECAAHFHETYGLGLVNAYAALRAGVRYFETSFAGLGGCPFAAVTSGNVCTEDLVHMLHRMGARHDVDLQPILDTAKEAEAYFERTLPGTILRTGPLVLAPIS